jgi:hypothetical protein
VVPGGNQVDEDAPSKERDPVYATAYGKQPVPDWTRDWTTFLEYGWWEFEWDREFAEWTKAGRKLQKWSELGNPPYIAYSYGSIPDQNIAAVSETEKIAYTALTTLVAQIAVFVKNGRGGHWEDNSFDGRNYVYTVRDLGEGSPVEYEEKESIGYYSSFVGYLYDAMRTVSSILFSLRVPCNSPLYADANKLRTALRDMLDGFYGFRFKEDFPGDADVYESRGFRYKLFPLIPPLRDPIPDDHPRVIAIGWPNLRFGWEPVLNLIKRQAACSAGLLSTNTYMITYCEAAPDLKRRGGPIPAPNTWLTLNPATLTHVPIAAQNLAAALPVISANFAAETRIVFRTLFRDMLTRDDSSHTSPAMKQWGRFFDPVYITDPP